MKNQLFRIVSSAITSFTANLKKSPEERCTSVAKRLGTLDVACYNTPPNTLNHTFEQRSEFGKRMQILLNESAKDIEIIATNLQVMRAMLSEIQHRISESQHATEEEWNGVRSDIADRHIELMGVLHDMQLTEKHRFPVND